MRPHVSLPALLAMLIALLLAVPVAADLIQEGPEEEVFQGPLIPAEGLVKRVDNFFFLIDASGSMSKRYMDTGKDKALHAKELLTAINARIPELDYDAGLMTLTPPRTYAVPAPYDPAAYGKAIGKLPRDPAVAGNLTALGRGLRAFDATLAGTSGSSAAFIVSDGMQNAGSPPLAVAQAMAAERDVCLHVISYATEPEGQALLAQITGLSDCSVLVPASALGSDEAIDDLLKKTIYKGEVKDTDGDGVPDNLDKCPDTPAGVEVDADGCPKDTDRDGVPDYLDQCPDTPMDLAVDEKGCPKPLTVRLDIKFDVDKADIKPAFAAELARFAKIAAKYPESAIVIEGHTDSTGSDEYNQGLSERRARAVEVELENAYGIDRDRISAKGYGESRPIASNETAEGRQRNRRVQGVMVDIFEKRQ